jgi:hypothetical protein
MVALVSPVHERLPMSVEELTAEWFTWAFRQSGHDVHVDGVEFERVIWGTATKALVRLTYRSPVPDDAPPAALCVKAGLDERMRQWGLEAGYRVEVDFYASLARRFGVRAPRCWFAGTTRSGDQALVVLDDLQARGCTLNHAAAPLTPDDVASGLEQLALVHARSWGWTHHQVPGLTVGSPTVRAVMAQQLAPARWADYVARPDTPDIPGRFADSGYVMGAFTALWRRDDRADHCVLHGDTHIGNTYFDSHAGLAFLDWQMMCLSPWSHDFCYFVAGALTVNDRRDHERDLLGHYLGALASAGGPALNWDDAWRSYEIDLFHGFMWATVDDTMQPLDTTRVMAGRHLAAIEDHNTAALLDIR